MESRNREYEITRHSYEMGQKRDRDRDGEVYNEWISECTMVLATCHQLKTEMEKFIMSGLVHHGACNLPSAGACNLCESIKNSQTDH